MELADTVTISSKGQVVIPAAIRRRMKLKKNDTLIVTEEGQRIVLKPVVRLSELMGRYKLPGGTRALAAMRAEDDKAWMERISAMEKRMKK